jgi:hypothetical protein
MRGMRVGIGGRGCGKGGRGRSGECGEGSLDWIGFRVDFFGYGSRGYVWKGDRTKASYFFGWVAAWLLHYEKDG